MSIECRYFLHFFVTKYLWSAGGHNPTVWFGKVHNSSIDPDHSSRRQTNADLKMELFSSPASVTATRTVPGPSRRVEICAVDSRGRLVTYMTEETGTTQETFSRRPRMDRHVQVAAMQPAADVDDDDDMEHTEEEEGVQRNVGSEVATAWLRACLINIGVHSDSVGEECAICTRSKYPLVRTSKDSGCTHEICAACAFRRYWCDVQVVGRECGRCPYCQREFEEEDVRLVK